MKHRASCRGSLCVSLTALGLALPLSAQVFQVPPQTPFPCPQAVGTDYPSAVGVGRSLAYGLSPSDVRALAQPATGTPQAAIDAWIATQLDPWAITETHPALDESTSIYPPTGLYPQIALPTAQHHISTVQDLGEYQILRAISSKRQLRERLTWFWENLFTTYVSKVFQPLHQNKNVGRYYEAEEIEGFRNRSMDTYYDLLFASASGIPMLSYLDNFKNTATAPNENYARELLELHTLGLTPGDLIGGAPPYTPGEINDLGRVFTGWTFVETTPGTAHLAPTGTPVPPAQVDAFRRLGDVNRDGVITAQVSANDDNDEGLMNKYQGSTNPAILNIYDIWDGVGNQPGTDGVIDGGDLAYLQSNISPHVEWVWAWYFDPTKHDATITSVFDPAGPIGQVTFDPSWTGALAVNKGIAVLQHLANHRLTALHICKRLYSYFVEDLDDTAPIPPIVSQMANHWLNNGGRIASNGGASQGVLDLLFANTGPLFDPSTRWNKVKTPLELVTTTPRQLGGDVVNYASVIRTRIWMGDLLLYSFFNYPSPEGLAESGADRISAATILQWTHFNQHMWDTTNVPKPFPPFGYNFRNDLAALGINLTNANQIVCHFFRILYPGNYTTADFNEAVTFLTTDASGAPITLGSLTASQWSAQVNRFAGFMISLAQNFQQ